MAASVHIGWTEVVLALLLVALYVYYTWMSGYAYWRKRKVPYLEPIFPFGNVANIFLLKKNFRESWLDLYNQLGDNRFGGIFSLTSPILLVKDPELIKMILTKDFNYFSYRGLVINNDHEKLINNIFFMEGDTWKQMRTKLSPAFTTGKLKTMLPILNECSRDLDSCLEKIFQNKGSFEAKDLMTSYTFDTAITCFFGLKATAIRDSDCELYKTGRRIFAKTLWTLIANITIAQAPQWYSLFKMHMFQYDACQRFAAVIKETIELRESHGIIRNDFLDILIRIKNNVNVDDKEMDRAFNNNVAPGKVGENGRDEVNNKLTVDDVISQIMGFFIGGFETTSSGLSFCLYELAKNPDVQVKMQRELDEAYERHGGIVTYQMLQELPYVDNVISETLRMYSTLATIGRRCVKPYRIPDTDVVIEKGLSVIIPSYAIHHDPEYYPEPFKFEPDRFLPDAVKARSAYTYLPFGEGPRMCIGTRFAKIQMKLALVTLFTKFNLKLNPKTAVPLTIGCGEFLTKTRDEILIDLCSRNDFSSGS